MKEEDIDRIFRDALADHKAPTDESDWAAFEGMLDSPKKGLPKWTVLVTLFILIGGSSAAYIFFSQSTTQYTPRAQNSFTKSEGSSKDELKHKESDKLELPNPSSPIGLPGQGLSDSNPESSKSKDGQVANGATQSPESNASTYLTNSDNSALADESFMRTSEVTENKDSGQSRALSESKNEETFTPASSTLSPSSDKITKSDKEQIFAGSSEYVESENYSFNESIRNSELVLGSLEPMKMLGINLTSYVAPVAKGDLRAVEPSKKKLFTPFIYLKLEQNNVFQTTPALGLGVERSFPLDRKGAIAVQAAIGYQRTGRLAWEQTSQNIFYGFDRYDEESNLKTDNLGMIQIPIRVSYQTGVHRVFSGAEMNWVVNASQEFRQSSEGSVEQGYLYDSGAPNSALFFQLGYGYAINEKLQLDLGLNIAGNSWVVLDKRPIGGFIRLNYFIR